RNPKRIAARAFVEDFGDVTAFFEDRNTELLILDRGSVPAMKAISRHLLEVLQPEISERNLTCTFDLKTDHALRNGHRGIIINENRHDVSINDVNHFIAARNDVHLIPIISFDVSLEFIRIAEHCEQPGLLSLLGLHDLSAPGDDAAACSLFVKLTAVAPDIIKVRLIAFQ